ncbi:Polymerase/histidinol phosphatase-like protein [Chaetomidium leptoderma]|uniref:Histidinol-phosphatase n=1 Tax=Chaetomidium leptoderma TaxID=669021 RepID=A0AAN6ZXA7_9PEZI|nr:Polymerase/histidinol phosphatase-like protein [Chaetomidium leptoderma]
MAFTMHSHSGQFCPGHAKDQLEDIILHAIKVGYKTIGLTEHMPRTDLADLYPEELTPSPSESLAALLPRHTAYLAEATRLQTKYAPQIHVLIAFESEWIRASSYEPLVLALASHPAVDYFIGSLHHTRGIPIDFDGALFAAAVAACGGTEEGLFEAYFDEQFQMLRALRPRVVGHFDLVRLFSSSSADEVLSRKEGGWEGVWERVVRNLRFVKEYGGWLECNTSGLRKGLAEAYPKREIAEAWVRMGGRFTFSDDSHGIAQVGTNYWRGLDYLEGLGVRELWTLERTRLGEGGKWELAEKAVSMEEFRASLKLE